MDKGAKDKLAGSPGENGGGQDALKNLHLRTGRDKTNRKTQERMERRSAKRSSSVGSEKMERAGDRYGENGEVLFHRPRPTAGCSANGRRRRSGSQSILRVQFLYGIRGQDTFQ